MMEHGGNVWDGGEPEAWLDFSANLRPEGPPDWVTRAMARAVSRARYYPERSMRRAREGLAVYLGVPPENVLPTAGGIAAIDLALSLRRGRVLISTPTFGEYARRARAHGREVGEYAGTARPGDTVVLCNPNNPTGARREAADVLRFGGDVAAQGGALLVDEAFVDFCKPGTTVRHDVRERMTVAGSLTKILGVPGARLGYLVAEAQTIARLERLALPWALGAMAEEIAAEIGGHGGQVRADAQVSALRRARFLALLEELGARPLPSEANFLLVDFGRDMTETVRRLRERGILVRTCESFGLGPNLLRLAVRTDGENERLIKEIEDIWNAF